MARRIAHGYNLTYIAQFQLLVNMAVEVIFNGLDAVSSHYIIFFLSSVTPNNKDGTQLLFLMAINP